MVPAAGVVVTSFRTSDAANSSGWWTVLTAPLGHGDQFTIDNYRQVWTGGIARSFVSSVAVALPAVAIPVTLAVFAAYAFTFMRFRGREALFSIIVALLVVPIQVAFVPLIRLYGAFDLNGTYPAAYLSHAGFGMPLAVFILRTYLMGIPKALVEAAMVDGASHYHVLSRVIVPVSAPAIASCVIFQFLSVWNDLLVALIFLGEGDQQTLTMTLGGQVGAAAGVQFVSGAAIITVSVPVLVFVTLQRYFVRGLTAASLGG
jgi:alpha-glucoside transport system permease protein